MGKILGLLVLISLFAGVLGTCGPTPEPTELVPTQTPWIVVVTATPGPEGVTEAQPTQTPWIIVASPTPTKRVKPTATERATGTLEATVEPTQTIEVATSEPTPSPTSTPEPGALIYPAPVLLDPPSGAHVAWKSRVVLKWDSVGELAEDEYYSLQLDRPPKTQAMQPYGDYLYLKETEYLLEGPFLAPFHPPAEHGDATVYWWVQVVRKTGEDKEGKPVGLDISAPSDKWILIVEPKPDDA
jgi:hypothetical protein